MTDHGFYRAFEDRHRGSRESILERLKVYRPFVEPLRAIYPESAAVDLGCGRGEWLTLMQQMGFSTVGVDIDEGMLSACAGRDLKTVKQDGVTFLKTLADHSQCVVSGFHIAEHLPFADLQVLVEEALRVLKPGGLLILETPNPENVAVGTTNFYLDPTHQRPIPPLLLEFLPEHYGFARIKILRLQEQPALVGKEDVALIDVFCGASPDYSVLAQKSAAPSIMAVFDEPFARPYGIELGQLANRFDAKLDRRFDALERRISGAENVANQTDLVLDRFGALHEKWMFEAVRAERSDAKTALIAEQLCGANLRLRAVEGELATVIERAAQFEARAAAAEAKAEDLERTAATAEARCAQETAEVCFLRAQRDELQCELASAQSSARNWQVEATQWHERLVSVHRSSSWRVTAPIRAVKRLASGDLSPVRRTVGALTKSVRGMVRPAAIALARSALKRPMLRYKLSATLHRYPSLWQHVTLFVRNAGLVPGAEAYVTHVPPQAYQLPVQESVASMPAIEPDLSNLSLNARRIYRDLQASVEGNGRRCV